MTATITRLTGQALLDKIEILQVEGVTIKHIAIDCGYVREWDNTKVAYTEFYTQIVIAKNITKLDENELTELKDKLTKEYGEGPVEAFLEWWDMEELEHFERAYIGCYNSGAEFAEEYVCDGEVGRLPFYVVIDWEKTWDYVEGEYVVRGDHYFYRNW